MNPLDLTQTHAVHTSSRLWPAPVRRIAPVLLLPLATLLAVGGPAVVNADGTCTTSGSQVVCSFSSTGAEQTWQVPPGVSSVQITAVGGSGSSYVASDGTTVAGGKGANVSATVPLAAGTARLYVEVGAATSTAWAAFGTQVRAVSTAPQA